MSETRSSATSLAAPPTGTAVGGLTPTTSFTQTRTAVAQLNERVGFGRSQATELARDYQELHHSTLSQQWGIETATRGREAVPRLLDVLAQLGFSWRDVARMLRVSVPAVQKWRRGDGVSGDNRLRVAGLVAACDLIVRDYLVEDIASWFEMPILVSVPVTPIDLFTAEKVNLLFELASQRKEPEAVLTEFQPDWRERYRSDFEVFRSGDGELSIRARKD